MGLFIPSAICTVLGVDEYSKMCDSLLCDSLLCDSLLCTC